MKNIIKSEYKGLISAEEIRQWRKEFPILENTIHVGNCSQSPQAKRVRAAIDRYLDNWLTIGMDWEAWMEEVYLAKVEFARLIGASADEIAVTSSVSDAIASVASFLDYGGKRNKILLSDAEFPTVNYVWLAHQKYGAEVSFLGVDEEHQVALEEYEKQVDEKTLITSATQVYYLNGYKQDLARLAQIAHAKGSLFMVDAYQGLGTEPVDVRGMDIDLLVSGNLKYLFGIPGIAFLYVKKELIPKLKPAITGWFGQRDPFLFQSRYLDWADSAARFDTGTPPVVTAYAARAGMEMINEVGVERIKDRIDMLSAHALEGCLARGLNCVSPFKISHKGATTAIWLGEQMDSGVMEGELKARNIIASARGHVIRVAPHFFTTSAEIDQVLDQIQAILQQGR